MWKMSYNLHLNSTFQLCKSQPPKWCKNCQYYYATKLLSLLFSQRRLFLLKSCFKLPFLCAKPPGTSLIFYIYLPPASKLKTKPFSPLKIAKILQTASYSSVSPSAVSLCTTKLLSIQFSELPSKILVFNPLILYFQVCISFHNP